MRMLLVFIIEIGLIASAQTAPSRGNKAVPSSQKGPKTLTSMVANVRSSVVAIVIQLDRPGLSKPLPECFNGGYTCVVGTGFFVNDKATAVTASHVVDAVNDLMEKLRAAGIQASPNFRIELPNFENHGIEIANAATTKEFKVIAIDRQHDLAILSALDSDLFSSVARTPALHIEGKQPVRIHPTSAILDTSRPQDGDNVFTCGFPYGGKELTLTSGHVAAAWNSEVPKNAQGIPFSEPIGVYRLDLSASPGNSGGPVFNDPQESVIGVLVEVQSAGVGGSTAIAIPAKYVASFLDQHHIKWSAVSSKGSSSKH